MRTCTLLALCHKDGSRFESEKYSFVCGFQLTYVTFCLRSLQSRLPPGPWMGAHQTVGANTRLCCVTQLQLTAIVVHFFFVAFLHVNSSRMNFMETSKAALIIFRALCACTEVQCLSTLSYTKRVLSKPSKWVTSSTCNSYHPALKQTSGFSFKLCNHVCMSWGICNNVLGVEAEIVVPFGTRSKAQLQNC